MDDSGAPSVCIGERNRRLIEGKGMRTIRGMMIVVAIAAVWLFIIVEETADH